MKTLSKKLFADFEKTEPDRKLGFVKKNAEKLIEAGLFEQCIIELQGIAKELKRDESDIKTYEQFESKLSKLKGLPRRLENQKKEEELKVAEKNAHELAQLKIKQEELLWETRLENFNTEIESALIQDQNVKIPTYFEKFEDLKNSMPQTIKKSLPEDYLEYLENHPPYISYKKMKSDEEKAKKLKKHNRKVRGFSIAGAVAGIVAFVIGLSYYNKKSDSGTQKIKDTEMIYDSKGNLTGIKENYYSEPALTEAQKQDRIYMLGLIKDESKNFHDLLSFDSKNKHLANKAGSYLSSLNALRESLNKRDIEGHKMILTELEKIEKNRAEIMELFVKSDFSFRLETDPEEIDEELRQDLSANEKIKRRKYQFAHLLVNFYAQAINSLVGTTEYIKDDKYASFLATRYLLNINLGLKFNPRSKKLKALKKDLLSKVTIQN